MRITEVAGGIDLMGFNFVEEIFGDPDVFGPDRFFLHQPGLVKGKVQEMGILIGDAYITATRFGFRPADQAFDGLYRPGINFSWFFIFKLVFDIMVHGVRRLGIQAKRIVEVTDKIRKPDHIFIKYSNIAAGLVGDVHFMPLVDETNKGPSHGNHIIIGMGAEDDHPFVGGLSPFRPVGIVCVGFASGPAGDGVLQFVEDADVDVVCISEFGDDITHAVFGIIPVG